MRYAYPAEIEDADGFTVTFPDVPEAITGGETRDEAMAQAADALVSALSFYADEDRRMPAPSPPRGRAVISVPALEAAKLALHDAMLDAGVSNVALAARLGCDEKMIRRLRDLLHASKIEHVEAALHALGWRVEISVFALA